MYISIPGYGSQGNLTPKWVKATGYATGGTVLVPGRPLETGQARTLALGSDLGLSAGPGASYSERRKFSRSCFCASLS
jgi:hypothetical protein